MKILLIEDNRTIGKQVIEFLEGHQWLVDYADCGSLGIELGIAQAYDVILLDLNLPDIDGLEVCRHIKQNSEIAPPILMLTARDDFTDKAQGFNCGADDYVTKPFDLRELALRCEALARRQQLFQNKNILVGELSIDRVSHMATRGDTRLQLTTIGFKILLILAQHYPNPVSRSMLLEKIWGDELPDSDALRSHIYGLRNALDKPFDFSMLKTITNVGFKLQVPSGNYE